MNTALVLSGGEFSGLIASKGCDVSEPMQQLLGVMCGNNCDNTCGNTCDIVSTLQEKHLAQWDGCEVKVEPLLDLIAEEAAAAYSFEEVAPGIYAVECPNMCLLVTRYEWAEGMWRIAPFQDMPALLASLD